MRTIPLTQGLVALVDDEDYDYLMQWKWHTVRGYAMRTQWVTRDGKKVSTSIKMHRVILEVTDSRIEVDHINGNRLDNQHANLRIATHSQNAMNRCPKVGSSSQYKGVGWHKRDQNWAAYVFHNKRKIWLGNFENEIDAALAHDEAARRYHGEFAKLNF